VRSTRIVECLETARVCRLADVKPSTLDYWVRTGLVVPTLRDEPGHRRTRLWSVRDAVIVRTVRELRKAGCPLQTIRRAQHQLASQWKVLGPESTLIWSDGELYDISPEGRVEALVKHPFQQAFALVALPLGLFRDEAKKVVQYIRSDNLAYGPPSDTPREARQRRVAGGSA
jgi:DNA-binding transcriptional MerR regulator